MVNTTSQYCVIRFTLDLQRSHDCSLYLPHTCTLHPRHSEGNPTSHLWDPTTQHPDRYWLNLLQHVRAVSVTDDATENMTSQF